VLLENNVFSLSYLEFEPRKPFLLFNPTQADLDSEWYGFPSLHEIMPHHALGVVTGRDDFAIDMNKTVLLDRIKKFCNPRNSDRTIANLFSIRDAGGYVLEKRRKVVLGKSPSSYIKPINYRPFDSRFVAYSRGFLTADQSKIMSHLGTESNIALATTRAVETGRFDHVFCTRLMMGHHFVSLKESNYAFPLFMRTDKNVDALQLVNQSVPNLSPNFVSLLKSTLPQEEVSVGMCLPHGLQPEDIFNYAYAIFHSPGYRSRFNELLVSQFPRLPLTSNLILFRALARLGGLTVSLHLLEAPDVQTPISQYVGPRAPEIERVSWSANTVWIDKAQTVGFKGVREKVWNFRIGGYQVCDKWLKDRKGRKLLAADIAHYQKVIVALSETISLMSEIDEVIEQHGGWPDAFQSSSTADKALLP
jgi:predicted helicase